MTYDELLRRPDRYAGELVYFAGRVRELTDDGSGRVEAQVNLGGGQQVLIVYYAETYFGHPLVQGDNVRFVGTFIGLLPGPDGRQLPAVEVVDLRIRFT